MSIASLNPLDEVVIAELLDGRFGDGQVYLRSAADRPVLRQAMYLGLVDDEGILTDEGRRFWQRRRDQLVDQPMRAASSAPYHLRCSEVWGGTTNCDRDIRSEGVLASLYSSASHGSEGGDIYYLSVCEEDALTRVVVADVVGHGEPVSRVSRFIYDGLRAHRDETDGGAMLSSINRLAASLGLEAMTTAAVVAYCSEDQNFYYSYAGHYPALVKRWEEPEWLVADLDAPRTDTDTFRNVPLAVFENARFDQRAIPLTEGDRVFLYTDGVVDAPGLDGSRFGIRRLKQVLDTRPDAELSALKHDVIHALNRHTGDDLSHDDMTVIALELR